MKKSQTTLIIVSILTIAILSILIYIYFKYPFKEKDTPRSNQNTQQQTFTQDDFTLDTQYQGNNTWTYTITGTLPNPCYSVSTNSVVMESYPEQVNITMEIQKTSDICAQVIKDVEETGTFNASDQAKITFVVD